MTETANGLCDLCQSPVEAPGFDLATKAGPKRFCCEGCMGIYRMLHEEDILEDANSANGG